MSRNTTFHKLINWEYWPAFMFYIPNVPYAAYLAIKAKSLMFFTAVNPAIKHSGNGAESKYKTIQLIPEKFRPKTVFVNHNDKFDTVINKIIYEQINFPLIAKPDIGFRGLLVQKIDSKELLKEYLSKYPIDIIIQELITFKNECGIFYYRLPNKKEGTITSITLKKFLTVIADGTSTLSELILKDERAQIYYSILKEIHKEQMYSIPKKGKQIELTIIGNHAKGTQFIDGNHLINKQITSTIDKLNREIKGWYYGRLDIKYDTFEKLMNGKDFKILEINGIISEPTHVYDATKHSYFDALKAIKNHWKIIYKVGTINHKKRNIVYTNTSDFINEMIYLKKYTTKIKKLSL
ncbi:ATP-grasp domain-containing protein [Urechidicola croceus]|uniref:Uncharacterized protein n=1 Tax=Urechidicola croceus TaxID=1850246 RepID=A0A1D8PBH8_9FLAO|nr:hypothetical protein [Urechidicola croceus]AOW21938.1 hypothetical protein LPB138_15125 [Urechidicola croceus]